MRRRLSSSSPEADYSEAREKEENTWLKTEMKTGYFKSP